MPEAVTRQLVDGDPRRMRELLAETHKNETRAERDASLEPQDDFNREVLEVLDALHARGRETRMSGRSRTAPYCGAVRMV